MVAGSGVSGQGFSGFIRVFEGVFLPAAVAGAVRGCQADLEVQPSRRKG